MTARPTVRTSASVTRIGACTVTGVKRSRTNASARTAALASVTRHSSDRLRAESRTGVGRAIAAANQSTARGRLDGARVAITPAVLSMALNRGHDLAAQIAGRRGEPKALVDDEQRAAELLQTVGFERRRVRCQRSPRGIGQRFADRAQARERDLRRSRRTWRVDGSLEPSRSVGQPRAGVEDAALGCAGLRFDRGDHDLPTRPTRHAWLRCPPSGRISHGGLGIGLLFLDRGIGSLAGLLLLSFFSHHSHGTLRSFWLGRCRSRVYRGLGSDARASRLSRQPRAAKRRFWSTPNRSSPSCSSCSRSSLDSASSSELRSCGVSDHQAGIGQRLERRLHGAQRDIRRARRLRPTGSSFELA